MTQLKQIHAIKGYQNISYILEDKSLFNISGYRFMKGRNMDGLARCIRVVQNGKLKLVYCMGEQKPLGTMYRMMNFPAFCAVLGKIIHVIVEVKEIGFLSCHNLDLEFDHIYLDQQAEDVKLVYLPVSMEEISDEEYEMDFRRRCVDLIRSNASYASTLSEKVCGILLDEAMPISTVGQYFLELEQHGGNRKVIEETETDETGSIVMPANMKLVSQSERVEVKLHIQKSSYIIGKIAVAGKVDGEVPESTISRKHCRILFINGDYYVEDLDSRNGTRVNGGRRIPSHQRVKIKNGDVLVLANIPFRVEI